jgi:hypothetical protein
MPALPVGKNQHVRTLLAKHAGDFQFVVPGIFNAAIGNIERLTPGNFQDSRRVGCFVGTILGGTARSHFTLGEVEDSGAVSTLGHFEQSSGAGLFHVIAVRG